MAAFEMLFAVCLAGMPAECQTQRLPGAETLAECRVLARRGAAGFPPHFEVQSFACVPEGETPAMAISEVAPGVFVHKGRHAIPSPANRGDLANLGFIVGSEAVAVIDTGSSHRVGQAFLAAIRAETDLPIRYVILTHMHPDHVLGASAFEGVEIVAHQRLSPALQSREETYLEAMSRLMGAAATGTRVVLPTLGIAEETVLELGPERPLLLTPHATAHTDNDLTVLDEATGTFFAGDLDFHGHTPALDGSLKGWQALLADLAVADGIRQVVPGHGPVAVAHARAFAPTLQYLDMIAAETRAAIAEGIPMLEAIRTIGSDASEMWVLFDEFNPRNATAAFTELEWE